MTKVKFPFDEEKLFENCKKNDTLPRNDFEKQSILLRILKDFGNDRKYTEQEVKDIITKYFEDYTLIRRKLINFGYMNRDTMKGECWVVKRELSIEDVENNIVLKRHSKAYNVLNKK